MSKSVYTDDELRTWWQGLAKCSQLEILETMVRVCDNSFAHSMQKIWLAGYTFTPRQLAAIRKWDS